MQFCTFTQFFGIRYTSIKYLMVKWSELRLAQRYIGLDLAVGLKCVATSGTYQVSQPKEKQFR